jgi:ribosome-associated protein
MIQITPDLSIDESEIQEDFVRSAGPGGQNVNKVASAVQLRFDVRNSTLPEDVRRRLAQFAGKRLTDDGILIVTARVYRTQAQNRQDALNQLVDLIRHAAQRPKPHLKTRPTLASKQRRLESKRRISQTKRLRQSRPHKEE